MLEDYCKIHEHCKGHEIILYCFLLELEQSRTMVSSRIIMLEMTVGNEVLCFEDSLS